MNITAEINALRSETTGQNRIERAARSCDLSKKLEKIGEYEAAFETLSEFWPERGGPPDLTELDDAAKAEVLLRAGALAGWLGSKDQIQGSQEFARNLITQSIELFEKLNEPTRVAEARGDLALCYWREGSLDEARIQLGTALGLLAETESDLKAVLLVRSGMVETLGHRLSASLRFYEEAARLLDRSSDDALKGTFHSEYGLVFKKLAAPEDREDYLDRALMEYAAASFHFEAAGNTRYLAGVENNLGYLYFTIGKYDLAHKHLDRARHLFFARNDVGAVAQVDDSRAQTLIAEGRVDEGERLARHAVRTLEKGDEQATLAEALTTHGIALSRLGDYASAKRSLQRAVEVAEKAGDLKVAAQAKLSMIEEMHAQTPAAQLVSIYQSAADIVRRSQDPSTIDRLINCAQKVIEALGTDAVPTIDSEAVKDFTWVEFKKEVRRAEKALIGRALREAEGSVTKAAYLLGFRHHQSLISVINIRHKDLLNTRSMVRKRRRHIFSQPKKSQKFPPKPATPRRRSRISVLHVEDDPQVVKLVGEMFGNENWAVETCGDGDTALRKLTGNEQYDLLVIDDDLPGLNGVELVKRARNITTHRRTPIVMLASTDCEREAWRAGVNAFLRKPEQANDLTNTATRLLLDEAEDDL